MTPAVKFLEASGISFSLHRYRHDSKTRAYAMEAAGKLDVFPDRLFKTLVVLLDGKQAALALVPGSRRLDLKAAARLLGAKETALAPPAAARRITGFVVGAISPFGLRKPLPVVADETALDHETLYVSAGKRGLQVEMRPKDLIRICNAFLGKISI